VGGATLSVSGATAEDIKSTDRGIRNICQVIAVDDGNEDEVSQFDEVCNDGGGGAALTVTVTKGHTYHFLFLSGCLERDWSVTNGSPVTPGTGNGLNADGTLAYTGALPTLLTSGYLKAAMAQETSADRLSLTMTPLVVNADTDFTASYVGVPSTGSGVGLYPNITATHLVIDAVGAGASGRRRWGRSGRRTATA
jgi:hypothetical protein